MRCFLSIDLPDEVKEELVKVQKELEKIPTLKAKFVEKENLHLTLKFLGEISDYKVNEIKEKLQGINFGTFSVTLGKLGVFPSEKYVRVIWVSLQPEEKVKELAKLVNEKLGSKDKRFESHVTLARVRAIKDKDALKGKLQEIKPEKKEFKVTNISLKRSNLTSKGPIYETLKDFDL